MIMFEDTIRQLIRILKEEEVDEIEVRRGLTKIRVVRRRAAQAGEAVAGALSTGEAAPATLEDAVPSMVESDISSATPATDAGSSAHLTEIRSPMVGTFYRSSNLQTEPFVVEGGRVEIGNVLCIIEAMKLMNEIESDTNGIIRKILVGDAEPVEFGQPLFLVESA